MSLRSDSANRVELRRGQLLGLGPKPPWYRPFARRLWQKRFDHIMAIDVSEAAAMFAELYPPTMVVDLSKRSMAFMNSLVGRNSHE